MIAFVAAAGVIAAAIATVTAERSLAIWILVAVLAFLGVSLVIIGIELVRLSNTQVAVTERGLTGPLTPDLPWRDIVRVSCSWRMNMGQRRVFVVITADAFHRLNSTKPAWLRAWHRIASHGFRRASTRRVTWLYRPTDPAEDIVDFLTAELTARTRLSAHHEAHPGAIQGFTPSAEESFTDHVDGNTVPADDPGIATCRQCQETAP